MNQFWGPEAPSQNAMHDGLPGNKGLIRHGPVENETLELQL